MSRAVSVSRRVPLLVLTLLGACASGTHRTGPLVAHLATGGEDGEVRALAAAFERGNPGYSLAWLPAAEGVDAGDVARILFVQDGRTTALVVAAAGSAAGSETGSEAHRANARVVGCGDMIVLRPGAAARFDAPVALLQFTLPDVPDGEVPTFVRPDQDPRITDTPGGCATDPGAYRRILLTWRRDVGPYTYRGLNAHRVRIDDSFTHYHPRDGGFDELYLVQAAASGAELLTSPHVAAIERRDCASRADAAALMASRPLRAGDLVYLPRGLAHRGRGGVLAQVITVPGFVPGAEIGIDHHLRAIDERFGGGVVPWNAAAAAAPVVR